MVNEPSITQSPSITVAILSERFEPRVFPLNIWTEDRQQLSDPMPLVPSLTLPYPSSATLTSLVKDLISQLAPGETLTLRLSDCADPPNPSPSTSSKSDEH
jgi:hypothetical protein